MTGSQAGLREAMCEMDLQDKELEAARSRPIWQFRNCGLNEAAGKGRKKKGLEIRATDYAVDWCWATGRPSGTGGTIFSAGANGGLLGLRREPWTTVCEPSRSPNVSELLCKIINK